MTVFGTANTCWLWQTVINGKNCMQPLYIFLSESPSIHGKSPVYMVFFLLFSFVALHKLFCSKLTWVVLLHEYSYGIILLWTVVITLDSSCLNTIWILWRNSMSFVYLPHHCRILRSVLPIQSTHEVTLVVSLFSLEQLYLSYEGVKLIFT